MVRKAFGILQGRSSGRVSVFGTVQSRMERVYWAYKSVPEAPKLEEMTPIIAEEVTIACFVKGLKIFPIMHTRYIMGGHSE